MDHVALDQDVLGDVVKRIVEAVRPERVILFGSWARGTADPDSDIDLFVEVATGRDTHEATTQAYEAIGALRPRLNRGLDIVVKDHAFVERYGDLVGTVVRPALREGRVLYAR